MKVYDVLVMSANLHQHQLIISDFTKDSENKGIQYPCVECEYNAETPMNLRHHKESTHEGVRYSCDE